MGVVGGNNIGGDSLTWHEYDTEHGPWRVQDPRRIQEHGRRTNAWEGQEPWMIHGRVPAPGRGQQPGVGQKHRRGKELEMCRDLGGCMRIGGDLRQELGMRQESEIAWEGQGLGRRAGVGREQKERTWEW